MLLYISLGYVIRICLDMISGYKAQNIPEFSPWQCWPLISKWTLTSTSKDRRIISHDVLMGKGDCTVGCPCYWSVKEGLETPGISYMSNTGLPRSWSIAESWRKWFCFAYVLVFHLVFFIDLVAFMVMVPLCWMIGSRLRRDASSSGRREECGSIGKTFCFFWFLPQDWTQLLPSLHFSGQKKWS